MADHKMASLTIQLMLPPKALSIFIASAAMLFAAPSFGQTAPLTIKISNVQKNKGKLVVEIYNTESRWLKNPFRKTVVSTSEDIKQVSFDVPTGRYAVSIYQDVNDNGELDRTFVGIPKEPIGFGNNYKPFGKPKYESALIDFKPDGKAQEIKLFEVF